MVYAIVRSGGKQYKVAPGDVIEVEHIKANPNDKFSFAEVLLYVDGDAAKVGNPILSGVPVEGSIVEHFRGEKIRVSKYKAKVRYRRVTGHRQELTRVRIEAVGSAKQSSEKSTASAGQNSEPVAKQKTARSSSTSSVKKASTKRAATKK